MIPTWSLQDDERDEKKKKKNNKENQWLQIVKTFIEEVNTQGDRDKLGRPI